MCIHWCFWLNLTLSLMVLLHQLEKCSQTQSILENICIALWNNPFFHTAMIGVWTRTYSFHVSFWFRNIWPFFLHWSMLGEWLTCSRRSFHMKYYSPVWHEMIFQIWPFKFKYVVFFWLVNNQLWIYCEQSISVQWGKEEIYAAVSRYYGKLAS